MQRTFLLADIFEREEAIFSASKLKAECIGGGRIEHDPEKKYIKVYGYSQVKTHTFRNPNWSRFFEACY